MQQCKQGNRHDTKNDKQTRLYFTLTHEANEGRERECGVFSALEQFHVSFTWLDNFAFNFTIDCQCCATSRMTVCVHYANEFVARNISAIEILLLLSFVVIVVAIVIVVVVVVQSYLIFNWFFPYNKLTKRGHQLRVQPPKRGWNNVSLSFCLAALPLPIYQPSKLLLNARFYSIFISSNNNNNNENDCRRIQLICVRLMNFKQLWKISERASNWAEFN